MLFEDFLGNADDYIIEKLENLLSDQFFERNPLLQKEALYRSVIGQVTNFFLNNCQQIPALLDNEWLRPEVFLNLQATYVIENYIELDMPPKDHQRQLQWATAEMYDWYMRRRGSIRQARTEHESLMSQPEHIQHDTENGKRLRQVIRSRIQ